MADWLVVQNKRDCANCRIKSPATKEYVPFVILFAILLTSPIQTQAKELVLMDTPLSQSEISKTLTLFEYDKTMGNGSPVSEIPQSQVSIGKPYLYSIKRNKQNSVGNLLPDMTRSALYLVRLRFSLRELPEGKHYQKVISYVDLGAKDYVAFDLIPKNVYSKEELTRTISFTPEFKFKGISGKIGEISEKSTVETVQPIISAFGEGESQFYWTYTCRADEQVFPGTKDSYVLIEVPKATKFVDAKMAFEVIISQDYFGNWRTKETKTDTYSERWNLSDAQPY
jgi:hypothetical protein